MVIQPTVHAMTPSGTDPLWLAKALVSVNPITRRWKAIGWPQAKVWDERYSAEKKYWNQGRPHEAWYVRCRNVTVGR